jgi:hypothetical protein
MIKSAFSSGLIRYREEEVPSYLINGHGGGRNESRIGWFVVFGMIGMMKCVFEMEIRDGWRLK